MKIILIFLLFFLNSCKEEYNLTNDQELNLFIMKNDTYEFNINATQNQDVKIIILTDIEIKCFINICEFNNFDNFSCFRSQNLTIRNEKENNYYKIEGGYPVVYNETKSIIKNEYKTEIEKTFSRYTQTKIRIRFGVIEQQVSQV
mgnify:CR=1 FL=1